MGWHFQTVFVEVSGGTNVSDQNHSFPGEVNFGRPDKIFEVRRAECALKSFHIGYKQSDHNFKYQRIAIRDVRIAGSGVRFNVETSLKDDTDDANPYLGEVEVLVIADVYPDP